MNFNGEIIIDEESVMQQQRNQVERLVPTSLLNSDQKFHIVEDFIWPTAIFSLQHATVWKLPVSFFPDFEKILKSSVKEILQLPNSTPD